MRKFWRSMFPTQEKLDTPYKGNEGMVWFVSMYNGLIGLGAGFFLGRSPFSPLHDAMHPWMFYIGAGALGLVAAFGYRQALKRYRKVFESELPMAVRMSGAADDGGDPR